MSGERSYLAGCRDPEQGQALEAYAERALSPSQEAAFEGHYFRCPACLDEIRLRQAVPEALRQPASYEGHFATWSSLAAGIAALLLAYPAYLGLVELPVAIDGA